MIESEISYLKNLLYSILAFILLLIFVSVSIFISKNADMEKVEIRQNADYIKDLEEGLVE